MMRKQMMVAALTGSLLALGSFGSMAQAKAKTPTKITIGHAQKVALSKYPGKIVGKTELENEDGKWQYAVNIQSGKQLREVMVGAYDGKIASVEVTTPAEEAAEAKAEAKGKPEADEKDEKGEKDEKSEAGEKSKKIEKPEKGEKGADEK